MHSRRLLSRTRAVPILVIGALAGATVASPSPAGAAADVACTVQYATNDWGTGFTANVTLRNDGPALATWKVGWSFLDGQQIQQGWNATFAQAGASATASSLPYNGSLATGASTSFGFNGTRNAANRPPAGFTVNGVACTGANKAPTVSLTAPAASDTYYTPGTIPLAATATDSDGAVAKVEFYAGDTLLATDTTAPFAGSWGSVPAGTYAITAKAYDDKGASATSSPVTVKVLAGPTILASPPTADVKQGGSATFGVTLAGPPSVPVTVAVAKATGSADLTATPASLSFTPANWNVAQNVTVASADNGGELGTATFTATSTGYAQATVTVREIAKSTSDYQVEFLKQYNKIKDPANGYFRKFGDLLVPYHSVETLIVEAPDQGHETTSEAFGYYLWLEASYGRVTGDWAPFNSAYASIEKYAIPSTADQPTNSGYDASKPATYAAEYASPKQYPSKLQTSVPVGGDPIAAELKAAYGNADVYGMHWLLDVDNIYQFGHCEDGTNTAPAFINTFQRGSQESVWETVTQPSCDTMKFGGKNGYLDLFTGDSTYAKQWKYTDAPDADARVVQVAFQAEKWAKTQGKSAAIADVVKKASKMGDYLRYSLFDKYFKKIGNCVGPSTCAAGTGKESEHYLVSWYYAWGGSLDPASPWAWRIGDGAAHQGYQNPLAAYALSADAGLKTISATGSADWAKSLDRQLEFLQWLQSAEGGLAGGATSSWEGQYGTPPAGTPTFYGMFYDQQPVWHDPPSNQWFGFQTWGMERIAEYYQATKDVRAKKVLDKWVPWAIAGTTVGTGGAFQIPSDLTWTGTPDTWNATAPGANTGLHVAVKNHSQDVGVAASLAKTLLYYASGSGSAQARTVGEGLLTALMAHPDAKGIAIPETRTDYNRFDDAYDATTDQGLYVPPGWTGTMPNGDPITASSTFGSIRSFSKNDPDWPKVQSYLDGGPAPTFTYHRFWAQSEIATAFAAHVDLFG
ncbi:glycoside hydrolase family 48 protein [Amycolatopsis sp. H20-H5]|uniref:glycoside hydrolase family 48 protein n=1 Tax=Amycolatopsis sp. H20-H5 TaxID=3046309 RepID=UPI002DB7B443|nr:glycoside hydrolase family 48 protein [Amycolatopsis sp. H20-H5]MEC3977572.1 glycoside hydrolase family 48 protein [Amycolatopsis sp. H20-H5]